MLVLEARDRVGGRAVTRELGGGEVTELGRTFIGPTQDRLAALAKEPARCVSGERAAKEVLAAL